MKKIAICGGGFKGIMAAYTMLRKNAQVSLIEKSASIGGIMESIEYEGFYLDKGVHLFDGIVGEDREVIEDILGGNWRALEVKYAAVNQGGVSTDVAVPDYSEMDSSWKAQALLQLMESRTYDGTSVSSHFHSVYGDLIGDSLTRAFERIYRVDPRELDSKAISHTSFHRVRILEDAGMLKLKQIPELDQYLAASSKSMGRNDYTEWIYPSSKGMSGFCESALAWLTENDCRIEASKPIQGFNQEEEGISVTFDEQEPEEFDHCIWCGDLSHLEELCYGTTEVRDSTHGVPMILFNFFVDSSQVGDFAYVQNLSEGGLTYRISAPGIYGAQIKEDGTTFVSCEVPCDLNGEIWNDPDRFLDDVWAECVRSGLIKEGKPISCKFFKAPTTFKLPKVGHRKIVEELLQKLEKDYPSILIPSHWAFTRKDILMSLKDQNLYR